MDFSEALYKLKAGDKFPGKLGMELVNFFGLSQYF